MDITYNILLGSAGAVMLIGLIFVVLNNRKKDPDQGLELLPSRVDGSIGQRYSGRPPGKGAKIIADLEQEEKIHSNEELLKKLTIRGLKDYKSRNPSGHANIPASIVKDEKYYVSERVPIAPLQREQGRKPFIDMSRLQDPGNARLYKSLTRGATAQRSKTLRRDGPLLGKEFASKHSNFGSYNSRRS